MLTLHPDILVKNGKKQFAILPYEEFLGRLRFISRFLHMFPNKVLADLAHSAARLPGSPWKMLF